MPSPSDWSMNLRLAIKRSWRGAVFFGFIPNILHLLSSRTSLDPEVKHSIDNRMFAFRNRGSKKKRMLKMFKASAVPVQRQKKVLLSYSQIRHCSPPWVRILLIWSKGVWALRDLKEIIMGPGPSQSHSKLRATFCMLRSPTKCEGRIPSRDCGVHVPW